MITFVCSNPIWEKPEWDHKAERVEAKRRPLGSEPSDIGRKGTCMRAVYGQENKSLFLPSGTLGGPTTAEHEATAQMLAAGGLEVAGPHTHRGPWQLVAESLL